MVIMKLYLKMKIIGKIQSLSDVITNSSSEVFLMQEPEAEYYDNLEGTYNCIRADKITWDWLLSTGLWEWEMVCEFLNIDKSIIGEYQESQSYPGSGWWNGPVEEDWKAFLNMYKELIDEKLIGLYFVDIEDHFPEACEVTENARHDSLWTDYRH